jgi:hypothetical protein
MSAPYARQAQVALLVLLTVTFLGGGNMLTGSGTWLAQAQVTNSKVDYDHLACYEVKCIDGYDPYGQKVAQCDTEEERVTLYNQFTDEKDKKEPYFNGQYNGQKVLVGKLTYLCVPTKKVHDNQAAYP